MPTLIRNDFQIQCLKIISLAGGGVLGELTLLPVSYYYVYKSILTLYKIKINSNLISFFFSECSACSNSDITLYCIILNTC